LGDDSGFYVLPGSDKAVYITDSPMEVSSMKVAGPGSIILAIGGQLGMDKLKPYLEGRERIFLASGRDETAAGISFLPGVNLPPDQNCRKVV